MDKLTRGLTELCGEDAAFTTQTYMQILQALHTMAVTASEQNGDRARQGSPALVNVYTGEALVFAQVAQELRRATAKIQDILEGIEVS